MTPEEVVREVAIRNEKKVVLVVLDGIGGLPVDGRTELEVANHPNLDELARNSDCGLIVPVFPGITPGSGPGHLAIFGYDPLKYQIGRGILEALGVGAEVGKGSLAVRGNFATLKDGKIVDRRAGRIPTEENRRLIAKLSERIRKIEDVEVRLYPGREHRFVLVLDGEGLDDRLTDADPQKNGLPPVPAKALAPEAERSAGIVNRFIELATDILKGEPKANTVLLRGFSKYPDIPTMEEKFKLKPAAIATYPMYKGLAKLVGMDIIEVKGESLEDEVEALRSSWDNYDFFYFHVKKTDSFGEDGNFEAKVKKIEEFDKILPEIVELKPDVLVITGDHSTPCSLKSHSWHPVPFVLHSPFVRPSPDVKRFTETDCLKGSLGIFEAKFALPLMMAHALKLKKFGA